MPERSEREKQLEWVCRVLITIDLYVIIAGYIAFFQASHQLMTPLVPRSTLYEVTDAYMKSSLVASGIFLAGAWLWSFRKRIAAIILFSLAALSYELSLVIFQNVSSS